MSLFSPDVLVPVKLLSAQTASLEYFWGKVELGVVGESCFRCCLVSVLNIYVRFTKMENFKETTNRNTS